MRKPLAFLIAGTLFGVGAVAHADVYKWIDARGATGYGESPPPGARNVTRLTMEGGNVSIIPLPRPQVARPAASAVPLVPDVRGVAIDDDATRLARWREQCVAERRVGCDNPTPATFDITPSFSRSLSR